MTCHMLWVIRYKSEKYAQARRALSQKKEKEKNPTYQYTHNKALAHTYAFMRYTRVCTDKIIT